MIILRYNGGGGISSTKKPRFLYGKKVDSYLNDRSTELSSLVHKFPAQKKIYMYTYILLIVFYFVQITFFSCLRYHRQPPANVSSVLPA
jgi:hypothetical protein